MSFFTIFSLRFMVFLLNPLQSDAVTRSTQTYLKTPCVLLKSEIRLSKGRSAEDENSVKWRCEIRDDDDDADTEPYIFSIEPDWSPASDLNETITETIISGLTTFFAPGCVLDWDRFAVIIPPGSVVELKTLADARDGTPETTGVKTVLVVRVVALDTKTTATQAKLADEWFGTGTDKVNLRSQYRQCSYGKLTFNPAPNRPKMGIKNGVVTVKIDLKLRKKKVSDTIVENYIIRALKEKLGKKYRDDYDHIAFCFPAAKRYWEAYGLVGGKITYYNDDRCLAVSSQMHEIGHNLMLRHSGIIGKEYGDTSCTMGYSVNEDSTNKCFSAPKSWFLGWYADRHGLLNPLKKSEWSGRLVGLSQYRKTGAKDHVILKIVGTSKNDIYVSLNTAIGMNSDTGKGRNKVLITLAEKVNAASDSILVGELYAGQSYSLKKFGGTTKTLDIYVYAIINPGIKSPLPQFARIGIKLMSCNDNKHIRFVYGKTKRSCSKMPVSYCHKVDDNGRVMRNYCHAKCNFCRQKRCLDEESYYWNGIKTPANSCAKISRGKCTKRDKNNLLVKEFCREKCSFCREKRAIAQGKAQITEYGTEKTAAPVKTSTSTTMADLN